MWVMEVCRDERRLGREAVRVLDFGNGPVGAEMLAKDRVVRFANLAALLCKGTETASFVRGSPHRHVARKGDSLR